MSCDKKTRIITHETLNFIITQESLNFIINILSLKLKKKYKKNCDILNRIRISKSNRSKSNQLIFN